MNQGFHDSCEKIYALGRVWGLASTVQFLHMGPVLSATPYTASRNARPSLQVSPSMVQARECFFVVPRAIQHLHLHAP